MNDWITWGLWREYVRKSVWQAGWMSKIPAIVNW
jgi:hypothetical protein